MQRATAGVSFALALAVTATSEAQPPPAEPAQPAAPQPPPATPPPVAPQPPPPVTPVPPPMPPAAPAPPPPWAPPPWGPPRGGSTPPPVAEPGPYYADVAAWSSILSTTIPMFGGFILIATAQRDDTGGGFGGGGLVEEEIGMQAAGFALVGLGAVVGPGVGHVYAGDYLWGFGGMGLRLLALAGGAGALTGGVLVASEGDDSEAAGGFLMVLGATSAAAGLGLMVWDLIDAPEAARRANAEERKDARIPDVRVGAGSLGMRWRY